MPFLVNFVVLCHALHSLCCKLSYRSNRYFQRDNVSVKRTSRVRFPNALYSLVYIDRHKVHFVCLRKD